MLKQIKKAEKAENFNSTIINRVIFWTIILCVLAAGICLRIFQPRPWRDTCMPFGNHTIVHNVSSPVCVRAIREGLSKMVQPVTTT